MNPSRGFLSGGRARQCLTLLFSWLLIYVWAGAAPASDTGTSAPPHHLVVLYTNDTHGHPLKFQYRSMPDVGGLPARATLVEQIRKENPNVLLLDAGDLNTGAPESDLFQAEPDIIGYNFIGYDAMALGNHEFDHPIAVLRRQMAMARFPFLSANVKTPDGAYLARPYLIRQFDGFKVAVLGLTTSETRVTGNPQNVRDIVFEDEVEAARALVPALRKQADIVIALAHLGIYPDASRGSRRLAAQVSGLTLIVDGHTHTRLEKPIVVRNEASGSETLIVQAWEYGVVLGRIDLWLRGPEVVDYRMELIPINLKTSERNPDGTVSWRWVGQKVAEDPELLGRLQPYGDRVEALLSENIGHAEAAFSRPSPRKTESALGNLVADAFLWYTRDHRPDFAFINAGAIRADIPEGPIQKKTVFQVLPFGSTAVVLSLKGKDVASLFGRAAAVGPAEGAFPLVSRGVHFSMDRTTGACVKLLIHGEPVVPDRTYRIATNSYLAGAGDGYEVFRNGFDRFDSGAPERDVLAAYIQHLGGRIRPAVEGRIVAAGR